MPSLRQFFLFLLALWGLAQPAPAQDTPTTIPERRLILERDTDFYGADLRALFDTNFAACRTACLTDPACHAFTFNGRSGSCFPKSAVTRRESYQGAVSALVLDTPAALLARGAERAADLGFLGDDDLAAARQEALALADRYEPGQTSAEDWQRGAEDARARGDWGAVLRRTGTALLLNDDAVLWTGYAAAALEAAAADKAQHRQLRAQALSAAINGYLRAESAAEQAAALQAMAEALEANGRGRDTIPALRLADLLVPGGSAAAALDRALGKYGFRITDHEVQSDPALPRLCATFSDPLAEGVDFEPYVQLPGTGFAVERSGRQLCIDGLVHGQRYRVTFRAGLPAASGEALARDVTLSAYVRDRGPSVRFPGRAYVLPRTEQAALPIVTVNLTEVDLTLRRVSDRNIVELIREDLFGRPLSSWQEEQFADGQAEEVWSGTGEVEAALNRDVTTLLPMAEAIGDLPAGLYALQARVPGADPYDSRPATQWFVISDIGLASMEGTDGLHVFARSLASAAPLEGLEISLLTRSNRVLDTVATDAEGYAHFAPGLTAGRGSAAPALVLASRGDEDMGFLSLTDPEFDLSDRGVEGRTAAGPIDVFLATERSAYRAGETVHATVLARDPVARAIPGLPLTAILTRPDGVEYARLVSDGGVAGGHAFALPLGADVPRGTWRLAIHADTEAPALASETLLVEDFLPQRIDVDLALPEGDLRRGDRPPLEISARYLFGAPGSDLVVEGEVRLQAAPGLADYPGYHFGRHDAPFDPAMAVLGTARTDAEGRAILPVPLPEAPAAGEPLEAQLTVRVAEGSGRPVERRLTRPLMPDASLLGIRPDFDGVLPEGSEAQFDLIGLGAGGTPEPMQVKWSLNRIETRYQWYSSYGNWNWEPVTRRTRIATGEAALTGAPARIAVPVDWGRYELVVERLDGAYAASSIAFNAGWYAPADATATPDLLEVSLDRAAYLPGDTAHLKIVSPAPGKALITVMSNRLIAMKTLDLTEGATTVDLPVTDDWGSGAYVTATLIRPMNAPAGHNPARALGLAHAAVDPGAAKLSAAFDMPQTARPRAPLDVSLKVDGLAAGETAYATIAAVDQGILNLTGHQPPDASGHYFGQRKLGMGLRDVYGRLIDGTNGAPGRIRSGGDAAAEMRMQAPPPTEALVAFFSGPVEVGADGVATARFDMPAFNGSVRLMAVVWSESAVGEATAELLVRDPVVLTASLPRFLSPGDTGRMLLELVHTDGPAGEVALDLTADGVALDTTGLPETLRLEAGDKSRLSLPISARAPGPAKVTVALTTPAGETLSRSYDLAVQVNDPETATTSRFQLAPGDSLTLTEDVLAGLRPGTGSALVAFGPLGRLDAPGLLDALDRYPYGCTEQVTSQALPLLYLSGVAQSLGLADKNGIADRIDSAIDRVLSRQSGGGGFGLWYPDGGDFWLDAYVSDFLSRARAEGHAVPDVAFTAAMDNLRNRLNYAADFEKGGEDIAYALLVLAREGAAPIGDLRYYADVKGGDFATPLASAQLGAALALYGDQPRADVMFRQAVAQLLPLTGDETAPLWRSDYGTNLRDSAGVLTLAVEAGSEALDRAALIDRVAAPARPRSTQESAWTLLAAHALLDSPDATGFLVDGAPAESPVLRISAGRLAEGPVTVTNNSGHETALTLTALGVPDTQQGARAAQGFDIARAYYTMEGAPADPTRVAQGERLVAVLTITPFGRVESRLMVDDPLPAGFEIDNPSLVESGDIRALDWLKTAPTRTAEFRQERFLAAVDWRSEEPFRLAYIVRAVTPGSYHHPAASVEDMYRPQFRGRTVTARVTVTE